MTPRLPKPAPGLAARVLTAIALGVVTLAAVVFGGLLGIGVLVAVIATLAVAEFYGLERRERRMPKEVFGMVATAVMPIAAALLGKSALVTVLAGFLGAALLWHLAFRHVTAADTATTVFGALYVGFLLTHLVLLRGVTFGPGGMWLVLVTIVSVWANDVFAYFVGVAAGRHKMAPVISPHKSWEGFFGGAFCCILVWLAAYPLIASGNSAGGAGLPLPWFAVLGVVVTLASLMGDLVESRFKRESAVKDSGVLLPGHGGFLDRFDSMIVVAPAVYYVVLLAEKLR